MGGASSWACASAAQLEAAEMDDDQRLARWYEWLSALAVLGGSASLSRKALEAKSRIATPKGNGERGEESDTEHAP